MASLGHNGLRQSWLPETCSCYHQACKLVWSHAQLRQELFQEYLENLEVHFVKCEISFEWLMVASPCYITRYLGPLPGVGGAARFLVVGTIDRQRGKTTTGSALDGAVLHSNTGLSSTQYEQIPITFGVWPFWLNPFFFLVNNILAGLWFNCISSFEITLFLLADLLFQHRALFQCYGLVKWLQIHYVNWSRVFFSNDLST